MLFDDKRKELESINNFHLIELGYPDVSEFMIKKDNDNYFWLERLTKYDHGFVSRMKMEWFSNSIIDENTDIIDHGMAGTHVLLMMEDKDREKMFH